MASIPTSRSSSPPVRSSRRHLLLPRPSHARKANDRSAATAEWAAVRKQKKYAEVSRTQHASFIPFSFESTGGMCAGARELLKRIAIASHCHLCLDPEQGRVGALQGAVAVCLLLCIIRVGCFNGNTDKTLCWPAVCAASRSGRQNARSKWEMGWCYHGRKGRLCAAAQYGALSSCSVKCRVRRAGSDLAVSGDLSQERSCELQQDEGQLVLRCAELDGLRHLP